MNIELFADMLQKQAGKNYLCSLTGKRRTMKHTNPQVGQMTFFIVMGVLERTNELQKQGVGVIRLEAGGPDFDVPTCVAEAARVACNRHLTRYTHSLGDPRLRHEITAFYQYKYGVTVDPDCIVATSSSSPSTPLVLMLLCNLDSEVILFNPGYAYYRNFVLVAQVKSILVPLSEGNSLQHDVEAARGCIAPHAADVLVNSPMNPMGTLLDRSFLESVASLGVPIISDEVYRGLIYEGRAHNILEYADKASALSGSSKRFAMTGLCLGYLVALRSRMCSLRKLQQSLFTCASSVTRQVGIAASQRVDPDVERMKQIYDERRRYMISCLWEVRFGIKVEPQDAFYIFADVRKFTTGSYRSTSDVPENMYVGITPSTDLGAGGEGYVRFSYANPLGNTREGPGCINQHLSRYGF